MIIEVSTRHGHLDPAQQEHLRHKAEKLQRYFSRLMGIEVAVEHVKHAWHVEILVSAEHKHDFVAHEEAPTLESAMDLCVQKVEHQLRRYKEKVQDHRDVLPHGGTSPTHPDLPEPPGAAAAEAS